MMHAAWKVASRHLRALSHVPVELFFLLESLDQEQS